MNADAYCLRLFFSTTAVIMRSSIYNRTEFRHMPKKMRKRPGKWYLFISLTDLPDTIRIR